jgi:hypothetical protein
LIASADASVIARIAAPCKRYRAQSRPKIETDETDHEPTGLEYRRG